MALARPLFDSLATAPINARTKAITIAMAEMYSVVAAPWMIRKPILSRMKL
ncbi:hypothetical protein D3C87_1655440 [compost metagenome]